MKSKLMLVALLVAACGPGAVADIEVKGAWHDSFGTVVTITDALWGKDAIATYDNAARVAIVKTSASSADPNTFSRYVWSAPQNQAFYLCIADFGLATQDAAAASTKTADPANLTGGCGGFAWTKLVSTSAPPDIEVQGSWQDDYGDAYVITDTKWGTGAVVSYDDAQRFAIVQSPHDDPYTADKFAKYLWTPVSSDTWWWCTVDYGLATADAALHTAKTADASHPDTGGCGTFPWSRMSPKKPDIEVLGTWKDNYGGTTVITDKQWGTSSIDRYDNTARFAVTKSPHDDAYTPDKYAKQVWTKPADGSWWLCTVDYGLDTADEAAHTTKSADPTTPQSHGCGNFPWTKMSAP